MKKKKSSDKKVILKWWLSKHRNSEAYCILQKAKMLTVVYLLGV